MQLTLTRTYHPPHGTDGLLHMDGIPLCFTIELPWLGNQQNVSCIPEGTYTLVERTSDRHQEHLLVQNVSGRKYILIHKGNNARKDLKGCIAPVEKLTSHGCGDNSERALIKLLHLVRGAIARGETVTLVIQSLKK
jgi:hypothetical protein